MKTINKAQGESKSIDIIGQILKGIKEMIKLGIVHRDLKPANILFHKGIYKIADFGMAKYLETKENCMLKSHVGTPYYMAPQIL
jgi:serine/threonine-protein kinase ULK/ATG1